jgi:hypothetical protein
MGETGYKENHTEYLGDNKKYGIVWFRGIT